MQHISSLMSACHCIYCLLLMVTGRVKLLVLSLCPMIHEKQYPQWYKHSSKAIHSGKTCRLSCPTRILWNSQWCVKNFLKLSFPSDMFVPCSSDMSAWNNMWMNRDKTTTAWLMLRNNAEDRLQWEHWGLWQKCWNASVDRNWFRFQVPVLYDNWTPIKE